MSEFKFIDKKKVVVVGKLNSTESIVQEIFIVNGSEVPQGENFVVKNDRLKDTHCESWEERQIREAKETYKAETKRWENLLNQKNREYRRISTVVERKIEILKKANKDFSLEEFEVYFNYLLGRYKYIVKHGWYDLEIIGFNTAVSRPEDYGKVSIRLISLYGNSDGRISHKINEYSDGSGSSYTIHPFKKYDDAVEYVKKHILDKKEIYESDIETAKKYGFEIPEEKLTALKKRLVELKNKTVIELEEKLKKAKEELEKEIQK